MNLTKVQLTEIAVSERLTYAELMCIVSVESGGVAFINGRIVIQFEPAYFRRLCPFAPSGKWSVNKVENQNSEYVAFSEAFRVNPTQAMKSTSWGLGQIMGIHHGRLGYKTVNDMVNDFKVGEYQQVKGIAKFVATDATLFKALKSHNWHQVAVSYNGKEYKALAAKYGREPYNISLMKAHAKYSA